MQVPDGWKLVPVGMTEAMFDAFEEQGYAAMLAAAPTPPTAAAPPQKSLPAPIRAVDIEASRAAFEADYAHTHEVFDVFGRCGGDSGNYVSAGVLIGWDSWRGALAWQATQGAVVEIVGRPATGGDDKAMREAFETAMVAAGYEKPVREPVENSQYLSQLDEDMYVGFRMGLAARPAAQADAEDAARYRLWRSISGYPSDEVDDLLDAARQEANRG